MHDKCWMMWWSSRASSLSGVACIYVIVNDINTTSRYAMIMSPLSLSLSLSHITAPRLVFKLNITQCLIESRRQWSLQKLLSTVQLQAVRLPPWHRQGQGNPVISGGTGTHWKWSNRRDHCECLVGGAVRIETVPLSKNLFSKSKKVMPLIVLMLRLWHYLSSQPKSLTLKSWLINIVIIDPF